MIIGCGYLGRRVADLWISAGHEVSALTRSAENARAFQETSIRPLVGDVLHPPDLAQLPEADSLLYAVGYDRSAAASKHDVYVNGLRNVLDAVAGRVQRVIYISSTSVYGQSDGEWIDESSPCEPTTENGRICLEAEQTFREHNSSLSGSTILRLAGLYGPGRLIGRIDQLRGGTPISGTPDAWLNLIHVDDAARCVLACSQGRAQQPLYLVADDEPVRRGDFYAELARRAAAPEPVFDPDGDSRRVAGFGKRCRNTLLHRDLVSHLDFPDYRAGLSSAMGRGSQLK